MLSKHKNGMTTVGKMIFWAQKARKNAKNLAKIVKVFLDA
jgi:hypothetical protein